ncbi:hypothetical protein ACLQ2E_16745 [Streptomyces lavendulocolor]
MAGERVRWPAVVDRAQPIVESYEGGVTLRQVMYRLVSAGVLPHTPSMYRRLSSRLAQARREGRFPDLFDCLEIKMLPPGPRFAAQVRFWVNGKDVVEEAVGEGGRGPYAADALPADRPSPLGATGEARRMELGEPDCTGKCCGFLTVIIQRFGEIVQWSAWELPGAAYTPVPYPLPDLHFDASQYDAEVARAEADRWWQVYL